MEDGKKGDIVDFSKVKVISPQKGDVVDFSQVDPLKKKGTSESRTQVSSGAGGGGEGSENPKTDLISQISQMPGGLDWGKQQVQLPEEKREKLIPPTEKRAKLNQPIPAPTISKEDATKIAEQQAKGKNATQLGQDGYNDAVKGDLSISNVKLSLAENQDPTNYYFNQLKASNLAHQGNDKGAYDEIGKSVV